MVCLCAKPWKHYLNPAINQYPFWRESTCGQARLVPNTFELNIYWIDWALSIHAPTPNFRVITKSDPPYASEVTKILVLKRRQFSGYLLTETVMTDLTVYWSIYPLYRNQQDMVPRDFIIKTNAKLVKKLQLESSLSSTKSFKHFKPEGKYKSRSSHTRIEQFLVSSYSLSCQCITSYMIYYKWGVW